MPPKPTIVITYCPKCNWLLRSAYMAQEILTTFTNEVEGVLLKPAIVAGTYQIYVNDELIFDRVTQGGFPEVKSLKQTIRNLVCPEKNLGHTDNK